MGGDGNRVALLRQHRLSSGVQSADGHALMPSFLARLGSISCPLWHKQVQRRRSCAQKLYLLTSFLYVSGTVRWPHACGVGFAQMGQAPLRNGGHRRRHRGLASQSVDLLATPNHFRPTLGNVGSVVAQLWQRRASFGPVVANINQFRSGCGKAGPVSGQCQPCCTSPGPALTTPGQFRSSLGSTRPVSLLGTHGRASVQCWQRWNWGVSGPRPSFGPVLNKLDQCRSAVDDAGPSGTKADAATLCFAPCAPSLTFLALCTACPRGRFRRSRRVRCTLLSLSSLLLRFLSFAAISLGGPALGPRPCASGRPPPTAAVSRCSHTHTSCKALAGAGRHVPGRCGHLARTPLPCLQSGCVWRLQHAFSSVQCCSCGHRESCCVQALRDALVKVFVSPVSGCADVVHAVRDFRGRATPAMCVHPSADRMFSAPTCPLLALGSRCLHHGHVFEQFLNSGPWADTRDGGSGSWSTIAGEGW